MPNHRDEDLSFFLSHYFQSLNCPIFSENTLIQMDIRVVEYAVNTEVVVFTTTITLTT